MAEIKDLVDLDQLKKQFPDVDESLLMESIENEGLAVAEPATEEVVPDKIPDELSDNIQEEQVEETVVETETDKKVPLKALQEERGKRQQLNAELLALRAELDKYKAVPATASQTPIIPVMQPAQPQMQQPQADLETAYYAELTAKADKAVRKSLQIGDEDIASLQFTDFPKFLQYQTRVMAMVQQEDGANRKAFEVQQANQSFVGELSADPLFQPVYAFYKQEIDEMPVKQAKALMEAESRIANNQGTQADRDLVRAKFAEYRQKYIQLTNPAAVNQAVPPVATGQGVNKAELASQHPRTGMLSGGSAQGISMAEIERLASEGKADQIPADFLERLLKGQMRG